MNARRLTLAGLISLCALVVGALVLSAAPALALETHSFSKFFAGEGEHALSDPQGVAVDQSTGEVYVVDGANDRVEVFSATGTFIKAFGAAGSGNGQFKEPTQIAVDNSGGMSTGDVYVLDSGNERVEVFNAKGEYQSEITEADLTATAPPEGAGEFIGIAVDTAGNLWVRDYKHFLLGAEDINVEHMYEFPGGAAPGLYRFEAESLDPLRGLAVDSSGDLYFVNNVGVGEAEPDGTYLGEVNPSADGATALTVDPANGDLYVDYNTQVTHFLAPNREGPNDSFGSGGPDALVASSGISVNGIAVNGSTGVVYVADSAENRVDVFDETAVAGVAVEAPSAVTAVSASLHGTVNPAGIEVASCEFEWGTEPGVFPHAEPCSPATPYTGSAAIPVSAKLGSLAGGTTYYYRLSATDANGASTNHGQDDSGSFTTPPAVEGLSTGSAEDVSASGAKLTGSLSPDGTDAHYYFEYGPSPSYGSTSPAFPPGADAGSGGPHCHPPGGTECSAVSAETTLTGLLANTTYYYRLVAVNSFGTTYGAGATFQTLGPPLIDGESAEVQPAEKAGQTHATLQAQITPDSGEGHETTYQFEYGKTSSYGTRVPIPAGDIGFGDGVVQVPAAELSGLEIATTYHYRVVAVNEYGTVDGPDQVFTTLPSALVEESVSEVTFSSAALEAQINPLGTDTTCEFQYVTAALFESSGYARASLVPCRVALGEGEAKVPTSVYVQGLAPGTVYHYRVVARNALGTVEGEHHEGGEEVDHTFTTQIAGGFALPDGREWEMVSPPDKHGAAIDPLNGEDTIRAAAAGGAIAFAVRSPTESEPAGSTDVVSMLGVRGADGWSSRDMTLPHEGLSPVGAELLDFSEDLSQAIVQPKGEFVACRSAGGEAQPCLSEEASEQTPFLRTNYLNGNPSELCLPPMMHCYKPLVTAQAGYANVPVGTKFAAGRFAEGCPTKLATCVIGGAPPFRDASPDLQHVVLESETSLTSPAGANLYEWSAGKPADEQLAPVSVLPPTEGEKEHGEDGLPTDGQLGFANRGLRNAISADGSLVFWTGGAEALYARDMAKRETLLIGKGWFQDASSDGSRVFYVTGESGQSEVGQLFECHIVDSVAGKLECEDGGTELAPEVLGTIPGASQDGSWVYFVSSADLAAGAVSGEPNLYVHHEGETRLVAVLSAADGADWKEASADADASLSIRVSPDGRWLTFMSRRELTGYDNRDAVSGEPDEEVFLYNVGSGSHPPTLVCASCDPSGARPIGEEGEKINQANGGLIVGEGWEGEGSWLAADIPGWNSATAAGAKDSYQPRYLSDSGRLFFDARDPLVAQAVNGNWDVYEYEPEGVPAGPHSCGSGTSSGSSVFEPARTVTVQNKSVEAGAGCVSLISSGESTQESAFLDADEGTGEGEHGAPGSEAGGEVFFMTAARLVPKDVDNAYDVYDAHECTNESPCAPAEASQPPACETEASCKAPPTPQPEVFGAPASATFSGAGNPAPATPAIVEKVTKKTVKCKRGEVKRKVKKKEECVKKPKNKSKAKKSDRAGNDRRITR
jgi:DNA-binding beta-propeller fold protein YncE